MDKYIVNGLFSDNVLSIASVIYSKDGQIEVNVSSALHEYEKYMYDISDVSPIVKDCIAHQDHEKRRISKHLFLSDYINRYGGQSLEYFIDDLYECPNDRVNVFCNGNHCIDSLDHIDKLASSYTYYSIYEFSKNTGIMYDKQEYIIIFKNLGG
jgi:6-pyruvoyl-tetrahydropterin synthase